jgi:WD40 repeat protein
MTTIGPFLNFSPMKPKRMWSGVIRVLLLICVYAFRATAQQPCPSPPPIRGTANGNMFNDAQEMDLGDAMAEQFEHDFHVVKDEQLNFYLNDIGQRLLAQMPPTKMKFQFVLVDIPIVNSFTMPGGRIYVTRKMVAFVQSEDELAGLLGHELGHALTHQPAADMSRIFRDVLDVKQVGDRADIFLRYNQLIENIRRKRLHFDSSENQQEQLVADSYALYGMSRAGYSPAAMASFWDRLAQTRGKTGNWLTDLFGGTTPNEQRLRDMKKYIAEMPTACIAPHPATSAENFRAWQQKVIAYSGAESLESLPGLLWTRQLSPPLESDINSVKFSPDGKYLLAQDDFNVYVLMRQPFRYVFRIPAENAEPASFTPDSQSVVVWTGGLHIEKWDIASEKRTEVHEVVVQRPCLQSQLSPDGNVVACARLEQGNDTTFDLDLLDPASGATLLEKKNVYTLGTQDFFALLALALNRGHFNLLHMEFSPDGHYFAISRNDMAMAWDLQDRSPVKLNGSVKDVMSGGFAFLGSDRIVGINEYEPKRSGVAKFPNGPAGERIPLGGVKLYAPAHGDFVIVRPSTKEFAVGVIDLKTTKSAVVSKMSALDVYDDTYARPQPDGSIAILDLATLQEIARTTLKGHLIGWLNSAEVSPDLNWFAGSGESHGGIWNLDTGQRLFDLRGFRGCYFAPDDTMTADFPAYLTEKRSVGVVDIEHKEVHKGQDLGDDQVTKVGKYLIREKRQKGKWNGPEDLEVHDVTTDALLWSKRFEHDSPSIWMLPWGHEMAFEFWLTGDEAKDRMKQDSQLAEQAKKIESKDTARFVEVLEPQTGTILGEFPVDTGKASFQVLQVVPAGKWVIITDNENRVLVYSLDGTLEGRLFGMRPAPEASAETFAMENDDRSLGIYNLANLKEQEELKFSTPLSFYQIVDHGTKLFALSEDQTAYLLTLEQSSTN